MKILLIKDSFGIEQLTIEQRPTPKPRRGEILLKMKAASLNYRDLLVVQGVYNPKQPLPLIPLSDGVGEVIECGEDVSRVQIGDRVSPIFAQKWLSGQPNAENIRSTLGGPRDGVFAEYLVIDQEAVVKIPEYLSDLEAATLPCAALTAWNALVTLGNIRAGETLLTQGTGGVSLFALQFAQLFGAKVIITSSSDQKLERTKQLGASETINYKKHPKWSKIARQLTDRKGVDKIIEVGGGNTLAQSLKAICVGGEVSVIGVLSGFTSDLNLLPILMQQVRLQGVFVGHRESFEQMLRAMKQHEVHPVIDCSFTFEQAQDAFKYMQSGKHFGKICINFDS